MRRHRPLPSGERSAECSALRGGGSAAPGRGEAVVFGLQLRPRTVFPYLPGRGRLLVKRGGFNRRAGLSCPTAGAAGQGGCQEQAA